MDFVEAEKKWKKFWTTRFSFKTRVIATLVIVPILIIYFACVFLFFDRFETPIIFFFPVILFFTMHFVWYKGVPQGIQVINREAKDFDAFIEHKKWDSIRKEKEDEENNLINSQKSQT